jgi:hypothetical protein
LFKAGPQHATSALLQIQYRFGWQRDRQRAFAIHDQFCQASKHGNIFKIPCVKIAIFVAQPQNAPDSPDRHASSDTSIVTWANPT